MDMILDILRKYLPVGVKVWVFGSRADWTTRDSSDLDLALEGDSALDYGVMVVLETAFEESDIPYKVDVIDLSQVTDGFRQIVDAQKIIFPITKDRGNTENNWHMVSLRDVVDLRISGVDKKTKKGERPVRLCNYTDVYNNTFINADMDFMTATATENEIFKCLLSDGDVIITKDSEKHDDIGVPALVRGDIPNLVCGYHLTILRPTPKIDGNYLYYALNTVEARHQFQSYANGITRFGLRKTDIGFVEIPLPPLDEQRSIAHTLRTLDDKIELNCRMNQTLEEMARTLFKSWFVDFDPVRAKMDGRWKQGESLLGLPAEYYDMFPDRLVDSELGEIPEGWVVKALDEIATFLNGLALQKYPANGGPSLPVIKIAQLRAGNTHRANVASRNIPKQYQIHDGDVLFSWSGSLVLDIWTGGEGALNQHLFKVESVDYPKWLYYHSIRRHLAGFRDIASDKATTMGHIQRHHIHEAKISIPNNVTLKLMSRHMKPLLDRNQSIRIESRTLVAQRNTLLPKLMSGEIRVRKFTEEVS